VGRGVLYMPTEAEATAQGEGPWAAQIVKAHANGSADLIVLPPVVPAAIGGALADPLFTTADPGAALADPLVTQANATANVSAVYVEAEVQTIADLANANKVAINDLVTLVNQARALGVEAKADINAIVTLVNAVRGETSGLRKLNVTQGGGVGQFSLGAGPSAV